MRAIIDVLRKNVRRYRLERGLTQEALAVRSGLTAAYISKLERGEQNPSIVVVAKVAKGLGVPIDKLVV